MSKALFLSNVGNRDLGKDGVALFDNNSKSKELKDYCRNKYNEITEEDLTTDKLFEFTEELYSSGVYKKLDLEPIIIKDKVKAILELHDSVDIVLFGTHQIKSYNTDAYYSACIIKYLLKKEFGEKINSIKVCPIIDNPTDYALMFEYYKKTLEIIENDNKYNTIYLGITGGTPALAYGLITCGALKWELKVKVLYKSPNKDMPVELEIGNKIFSILKDKEFKILHDKHLYELCAEIGRDYNLIPRWKYHHLLGLNYKKLFDFKRALEEFKKACSCETIKIKDKKEIQKEIELIKSLVDIDVNKIVIKDNIELYAKLIDLLIENAKIKWKNGECVDFVGRIFRLKESMLKMIIEKEFNISTNPKKIKDENGKELKRYLEFEKFLEDNPDILNYLEKETNWNSRKEPNNKVLHWILGYMVSNNKKWKKYGKIYGFSINLEKLSELRNESILAHGFRGISKRDIIEKYNSNGDEEKIIRDLDEIKKHISEL